MIPKAPGIKMDLQPALSRCPSPPPPPPPPDIVYSTLAPLLFSMRVLMSGSKAC